MPESWYVRKESREMLGAPSKLREDDLSYALATRTRSSPRMRVKLPRVICHDDGHEKTVTDVITLTKHNTRIEHLG